MWQGTSVQGGNMRIGAIGARGQWSNGARGGVYDSSIDGYYGQGETGVSRRVNFLVIRDSVKLKRAVIRGGNTGDRRRIYR